MTGTSQFSYLAQYNGWMNGKLYGAAAALPEAELAPSRLAAPVAYPSRDGGTQRKRLADLLLHAFNHQTHHRGQITTLFSQLGVDVGDTDLLLLLPETP